MHICALSTFESSTFTNKIGNLSLLHLLVEMFPRHELPLRVATTAGQLQAVKFMYSTSRENAHRYGFINLLLIAKIAAKEKHHHILEWLDNILTGDIWGIPQPTTNTLSNDHILVGWKTLTGASVPKFL